MVNGLGSNHEDHQGFFDRILLIPSGTDHDADFDYQLEDMDENVSHCCCIMHENEKMLRLFLTLQNSSR